jgi:hypothetical protein
LKNQPNAGKSRTRVSHPFYVPLPAFGCFLMVLRQSSSLKNAEECRKSPMLPNIVEICRITP